MLVVSVVIPAGEAVWCFPFRPHRELSPSRPRADVATRPLGFVFSHQTPMSVPRREFCCRRVFGFVISLVAEMKMGGDGWDNIVCQGMDGARHKASRSALSPFLDRQVNQKSAGGRRSRSPGQIGPFAASLSSRLLSNHSSIFKYPISVAKMCFFDLLGRQAARCSAVPPPGLRDARARRRAGTATRLLRRRVSLGGVRGRVGALVGGWGKVWVLLGVSWAGGSEDDAHGGDWGYGMSLVRFWRPWWG